MVELYINDSLVELSDNIDFNFTYQSIDESNLSNTKNSFSKQVKIKGTPNNNIIFNHFFRNDIYLDVNTNAGGEMYNPNKKVPFMIMQNGKVIERGYSVLDSIDKNIQDITYNLTLYGSIGNFFYNLTFKENGEKKKLSDLYYNWSPCLSIYSNNNYLSQAEEDTALLYKVDAATIAASWRRIDTLKNTQQTQISDDVVFVPAYCGLNNNFNSKKMLVNVYNGYYLSESGLTAENLQKFKAAFPRNKTIDGVEYKAISKNYIDSQEQIYGIVELPRNIDPWEANELRATEMPIAIRLSKLIDTICNRANTNVEVSIDDDIKNSLYYQYGWVLLGKVNFDAYVNNVNSFISEVNVPTLFDDVNTILNKKFSGVYDVINNNINYDLEIDKTKITRGYNIFNLVYSPYIRVDKFKNSYDTTNFNNVLFQDLYYATNNKIFVTGNFDYNTKGEKELKNCWNTETIITFFKENGNVTTAKVDLFYFDNSTLETWNQENKTNHGYGKYYRNDIFSQQIVESVDVVKNYVLANLAQWINNRYGVSISIKDITVHDLEPQQNIIFGVGDIDYIELFTDSQNITYNINIDDVENFSISQIKLAMKTNLDLVQNENTVDKTVSFSVFENHSTTGSTFQEPFFNFWSVSTFGKLYKTYNGYWNLEDIFESDGYINFKQNVDINSTIYSVNSESISIPTITKKELFSSTLAPSEYLSNFAKILNLRFDYDFEANKLYIVPLTKYYVDKTIELDNNVDLSRTIKIKPLCEYGIIDLKQETPDIYANYLYKQIENEVGFADEKYITENKTTSTVYNLFEKTTSKNTIDWRLGSVFFNQVPQLPSVYNLSIINWTLSNVSLSPEVSVNQNSTLTNGLEMSIYNTIHNTNDTYKKLCLFDKSEKYVDAVANSFVFLNGFTKNFGYVENTSNYVLYPNLMITNDAVEQWTIGKERCYMYSFKYTDDFNFYGISDFNMNLYSSPYFVPVFSRCLSNLYNSSSGMWYDAESIVASWNIAKPKVESYVDTVDNMTFVKDSKVKPDKTIDINEEIPSDNEYYIENYKGNENIYIYKNKWEKFIGEMYGPNNRNIILYAKIYDSPTEALKKLYKYDGGLWIITKIENYNIDRTKDNFSKVTLHRIEDKTVFVE